MLCFLLEKFSSYVPVHMFFNSCLPFSTHSMAKWVLWEKTLRKMSKTLKEVDFKELKRPKFMFARCTLADDVMFSISSSLEIA